MTMILSGTNGGTFPSWTTAGRPAAPAVGQVGYNTTIGQFDVYTASGWTSLVATTSTSNKVTTSQMPTGSVLQVVTSTPLGASFTTSSGTYVTTGITASITPTSASSKVLVLFTAPYNVSNASAAAYLTLYKNGSNAFDADGFSILYFASGSTSMWGSSSLTYLDSPASTSAQTYAIYAKTSGTMRVGDTGAGDYRGTVTLLEIAA